MSRLIIAIEGPSGIGKSELLRRLMPSLAKRAPPFQATSNVETTSLQPLIRELARSEKPGIALCLALAAARALLLERTTGNLLVDRYVLSSLVYQTFSGIDREYIYQINAPLLAGVVTVALEARAQVIAGRRETRQSNQSDFFKRSLGLEDEIALYGEGIAFLRARGHPVISVNANEDAAATAMKVADIIGRLDIAS
ncbi:hypothetical protein [Mesorhizobium sp. WSM2239]|uniref:Thymidylate kinase-like domain-containing protein n=2 Tax=unclassified Mesorhizobium TaxID=325217 RepID=A0AAU8D7B2_9HYPH